MGGLLNGGRQWLAGSKEIAKAQHGCIDCFAAMICAEVGTLGILSQLPSKPVQGEQKMKKLIEEIPEGEWRSSAKGAFLLKNSASHFKVVLWADWCLLTSSEDIILMIVFFNVYFILAQDLICLYEDLCLHN